jgi:hypothetical protein
MDTGMSNSSGVAGAFGKNESLESCGFCSEDFFNTVEPTFAISTITRFSACTVSLRDANYRMSLLFLSVGCGFPSALYSTLKFSLAPSHALSYTVLPALLHFAIEQAQESFL